MPKAISCIACLGLLSLSAAPFAQTPAKVADVPTFPQGTPVVTVPYARAVDFDHLTSLHMNLTFNGGEPHSFDIDTGSVGIMVGADMVPGFDGKGEPGEIIYSSSGVHLMGVWTTVDIGIPDAHSADGKPVTAHMQVLAVTKKECLGTGVNAAKCDPGSSHATMLGIGFGRGKGEKYDAATRNLFLMLDAMQNGKMRRGYTITPAGVQLGLNAETVNGPWVWQKLTPREGVVPAGYNGPKDWATAPGFFAVKGSRSPMGTILMDTGLTNMMLESSGMPADGDLAQGTPIDIYPLSGRLHYQFLVNDPVNPATPRKVSWRDASRGTFVNTGLKALALYDYCYDADGGYLGLKPRS